MFNQLLSPSAARRYDRVTWPQSTSTGRFPIFRLKARLIPRPTTFARPIDGCLFPLANTTMRKLPRPRTSRVDLNRSGLTSLPDDRCDAAPALPQPASAAAKFPRALPASTEGIVDRGIDETGGELRWANQRRGPAVILTRALRPDTSSCAHCGGDPRIENYQTVIGTLTVVFVRYIKPWVDVIEPGDRMVEAAR